MGYGNFIRPKASKKIGLRASRPFEFLHMDVSRIRFNDHTKAFLYVVKDNFSKAVLSYSLDFTCNSATSKKNLELAFQKYNLSKLSQIELVTDDGSENKGYVTDLLSTNTNVTHRIAQSPSFPKSNSSVESFFHTLKKHIPY
mgnify:CR=1 FL=1